tara:strand:+ start:178 stop:318 length:141 start_codon:yes stop_codon:yes gene_type:complete
MTVISAFYAIQCIIPFQNKIIIIICFFLNIKHKHNMVEEKKEEGRM